jgi:hypothetical protein
MSLLAKPLHLELAKHSLVTNARMELEDLIGKRGLKREFLRIWKDFTFNNIKLSVISLCARFFCMYDGGIPRLDP